MQNGEYPDVVDLATGRPAGLTEQLVKANALHLLTNTLSLTIPGNVEVHAFVANGKYCVVNNTYVPQDTVVYTDNGSFELHLDANEIKWYNL